VQALPTIQVPATVQAVLAARIDRLPSEEKRLLQTAAVIGTEVPLPLLQVIAELPEAALHGGLAHLQAAEFLYETRLFPEREYTFKHALTHEVAYSSLLQERRHALYALNQYIVYTLSRQLTQSYTMHVVPEEAVAQQQTRFPALLRELGQASSEAIRAVLVARDQVEPEPDLTPDTVAQLRARLAATASDSPAEEA
jgi:hypothetical protein